jgi:hypothetical protein
MEDLAAPRSPGGARGAIDDEPWNPAEHDVAQDPRVDRRSNRHFGRGIARRFDDGCIAGRQEVRPAAFQGDDAGRIEFSHLAAVVVAEGDVSGGREGVEGYLGVPAAHHGRTAAAAKQRSQTDSPSNVAANAHLGASPCDQGRGDLPRENSRSAARGQSNLPPPVAKNERAFDHTKRRSKKRHRSWSSTPRSSRQAALRL